MKNAKAAELPRAGPDRSAAAAAVASATASAAAWSSLRAAATAASCSATCRRYSARAGNRRFWWVSALRAHTKAPYESELLGETLRPLNRPGRARTVDLGVLEEVVGDEGGEVVGPRHDGRCHGLTARKVLG